MPTLGPAPITEGCGLRVVLEPRDALVEIPADIVDMAVGVVADDALTKPDNVNYSKRLLRNNSMSARLMWGLRLRFSKHCSVVKQTGAVDFDGTAFQYHFMFEHRHSQE